MKDSVKNKRERILLRAAAVLAAVLFCASAINHAAMATGGKAESCAGIQYIRQAENKRQGESRQYGAAVLRNGSIMGNQLETVFLSVKRAELKSRAAKGTEDSAQMGREKTHFNSIIAWLLMLTLAGAAAVIYKKVNKRLHFLTCSDPVTKGYSVVYFERKAAKEIKSAPAGAYTFLSVNINKFKLINDAFGMDRGDRTLKYVHDVLERQLGDKELVCRSFSDNFDLLVKTDTQDKLLSRIDRMLCTVNSFNSGRKNKYLLTFTVGAYCITDRDIPVVNMRDRANAARKSKDTTARRHLFSCVFYSDRERSRQQKEKMMENEMDGALKRGEFIVCLQPKMALKSNRIVGAEALVRWEKGSSMIMPDEFMPLFERNGFIIKLDLYVFERVCGWMREWLDLGERPVPISVNLSRAHLDDDEFLGAYIAIQKKYEIPKELVELELTETLLADNMKNVEKALEKIHHAGYLCSLDDFGSGYSSLNILKDIHFDILKLDKGFFKAPGPEDENGKAIIEAVVRMAKKLKMYTVAEGVETEAQINFLRAIQCDAVQGYAISRPVGKSSFEQMVFGGRRDAARGGAVR